MGYSPWGRKTVDMTEGSLSLTPWTISCQASLSFPISRILLKLMSFELVMPSSHLILYPSLLLLPFSLSQHQGLF